jgi:hypothetical protein
MRSPEQSEMKWGWLGVVAAAVALALALGSTFNHADGATTQNLRQLHIENDAFLNYDFSDENHSSSNVDWPITIVFWNGATSVDHVKDILGGRFDRVGSRLRAYINNGAGWSWDGDKGRKENQCGFGDSAHYRIYAPSGQNYFFNSAWGFYAIASTHLDHNECTEIGEWSGLSSKAERYVADEAENILGRRDVHRNVLHFANAETERNEGTHHWRNEGEATTIKIPPE